MGELTLIKEVSMAHLIEANDTLFSANGITPWHGLGRVLQAPPSIEEGLIAAGLDWNVQLQDIQLASNGLILDHKATVRQDTGDVLGVVGSRYCPLQNTDAFKVFEPLVESGDITLETAGSLRGNRVVWILAKINRGESQQEISNNGDVVNGYVLLSHSHDGTTSIKFGLTPVRVVCNNTLSMAQGNAKSKLIRVKHTSNAVGNLESLRNALDLQLGQFVATADIFRQLARTSINSADLQKFVSLVLKEDEDAECRKSGEIIQLFECGVGSDLSKATAWGAFNAITEFTTHHRGRSAEGRLFENAFGQGKVINDRALVVSIDLFLKKAA